MIVPAWFWIVTTFLLGITIGSFLNVVIWRLPRGGSLVKPSHSQCPHCETQLTAVDLVPLLSFLVLGRKCRTCKAPISWRYFTVELLTGVLFVALYLRFPQDAPNCIALLLFAAVLIPIYFIDLATFTIPNSLNLAAFAIAVGRDVWGILQQEPGHELLWGWLPRSILGAVVGILIFGTVRVLGWLWKRQEAMGLGDVLLARAMGAMLVSVNTHPAVMHPLRLFTIWVVFSCFSGVLVGPALILWRHVYDATGGKVTWKALSAFIEQRLADGKLRKDFYKFMRASSSLRQKLERDPTTEEIAREMKVPAGRVKEIMAWQSAQADEETDAPEGNGSSLHWELREIGYCLVLGDAFEYVIDLVKGRPDAAKTAEEWDEEMPVAPTAIPFGPFMVIGFLATVFIGEWVTASYLAYALPKSQP